MIVDIQYLPRLDAKAFPAEAQTVVISVQTPGQPPAQLPEGFADVLRLWFDDLSETLWTNPATRPFVPDQGLEGAPVDTLGFIWFDSRLAEIVRCFIRKYHEDPRPIKLLVHCEAGQSRSAAIACWASAFTGVTLSFDETARRLINDRVLRLLRQSFTPIQIQ